MNRKLPIAARALTVAALAGALSAGLAAAGDTTGTYGRHRGHHGMAADDASMGGHRRGEAMQQLLSGLDLTDAQRAEVREIVAKHRNAMRPLVDDVASARMDLNAAVAAPAPSEAAIRAASERLVDAQTAAALERARIGKEIRRTLTPAQQKLFDEHRAQMRDQVETRMRGRHGRVDARDDDSSSESKK